MKLYIKSLAFAAIALPIIASCSNENEPSTIETGKKLMTFDCRIENGTRATDTAFEENDEIGVYVVNTGELIQPAGNEVNNKKFKYNGTAWAPDKTVYWNDGTFDVYAYYPYCEQISDTEEMTFTVKEDQSDHANYTASDFIWASKEEVTGGNDAVSLEFSHRLSKVMVTLEKGEGFTGDIPSNCEVYIHSTGLEASVNLKTGNASTSVSSPTGTIKALQKDNTTFEAIAVPQNITSRLPLVEVVADGVSYLMEGKISLRPGYCHNITITLTKNPEATKIEIGGSISGWGN